MSRNNSKVIITADNFTIITKMRNITALLLYYLNAVAEATDPKWLLTPEGKHHLVGCCHYLVIFFYLAGIKYIILGEQYKTWTQLRSMCDNFDDGGYTLPVPDSQQYQDAIVALAGNRYVAIGFSDKTKEGRWINVYNGMINIINLLLIIIFQENL